MVHARQSDFDVSSPVTADKMSSQEAQACFKDVQDLQDQIDLLWRQAICNMQRQIQRTASLVVRRFVCPATVEHSHGQPLTDYLSSPVRKCKLRDLLNQADSQGSPEDFAHMFTAKDARRSTQLTGHLQGW